MSMKPRCLVLLLLTACLQENDPMGLPTSRDVSFTPNSPVPSTVLNNIQDSIIADHAVVATLFSAAHTWAAAQTLAGGVSGNLAATGIVSGADVSFTGVHYRNVIANGQPAAGGSWHYVIDISGGVGVGPYWLLTAASDITRIIERVPVEEGETIVSWSVDVQNDSTDHASACHLVRTDGASFAFIDFLSQPLGSGRGTLSNPTLNHAVVAGEAYFIFYGANATSASTNAFRFYKARFGVTRP